VTNKKLIATDEQQAVANLISYSSLELTEQELEGTSYEELANNYGLNTNQLADEIASDKGLSDSCRYSLRTALRPDFFSRLLAGEQDFDDFKTESIYTFKSALNSADIIEVVGKYTEQELEDYALSLSPDGVRAPPQQLVKGADGPHPHLYTKYFGGYRQAMNEFGLLTYDDRDIKQETRAKIVRSILNGNTKSREIAEGTDLSWNPTVAAKLKRLAESGVLNRELQGRSYSYSLNQDMIDV